MPNRFEKGLEEFRQLVSLQSSNASNTAQALQTIRDVTGYYKQVSEAKEEAQLKYDRKQEISNYQRSFVAKENELANEYSEQADNSLLIEKMEFADAYPEARLPRESKNLQIARDKYSVYNDPSKFLGSNLDSEHRRDLINNGDFFARLLSSDISNSYRNQLLKTYSGKVDEELIEKTRGDIDIAISLISEKFVRTDSPFYTLEQRRYIQNEDTSSYTDFLRKRYISSENQEAGFLTVTQLNILEDKLVVDKRNGFDRENDAVVREVDNFFAENRRFLNLIRRELRTTGGKIDKTPVEDEHGTVRYQTNIIPTEFLQQAINEYKVKHEDDLISVSTEENKRRYEEIYRNAIELFKQYNKDKNNKGDKK